MSSNEIEKRTDFYLPPIVDPSADTSNLTSGDRAMSVDIFVLNLNVLCAHHNYLVPLAIFTSLLDA